MRIFGIKGVEYEKVKEHLKGTEAAVMSASKVFGTIHVETAAMHATRSFKNGTNRSKTFVTEFLLYMAGERQISKALSLMTPAGKEDIVAVIFDDAQIPPELEKKRNDSVIAGNEKKAKIMGLNGTSCEDLVLEMVAFTDILKN